ncbi:f-box/lrr protein, putative [Anopheles sinensis]|uniref:F-box/lrr protein, putative n=1 Tax=Anopheles sinensis TaxID=74873 RepID=A0A084WLU4_ANOSI|nr:f-box/lrr protein, putative [Anopheles sinensis]
MALQADQASASTTSIEKVENDESDLRSSDLAPHDANVEEFGPRYADLPMEVSLTDVSLLFNFRLVELRELSLARCKQLTHEGIQALVRGCPAIEQLDLSECCNIKDETVRQIVIHLRRLRVLSLYGCYQLTDYSLDHIACHCHRLRVLDVRDCKQMDGDPARRLVNLKQLTTIRKSEHKV